MDEVGACFAENLKALRLAAGLSPEELADRADLHRTQISKFERGETRPLLGSLVRLAGALRVDPDDLLEGVRWVPTTLDRNAYVRGRLVRKADRDA